jgi:hypothetical protein
METIPTLLLAASFSTLGFILRNFSDSYIKEKGKNAATKEDIEEITKKVESIRTDLSVLSSFRIWHHETQQKHLLAFYDVAIELLHERYAVNFGDLPSDNGKSLFSFQERFNSNIVSLLREYQRLLLFIPSDCPLIKSADDMVGAAIKSQDVFKANYGAVKMSSVAEQQAYSSGDKSLYHQAVKDADVANEKYWSEIRHHIEAFRKSLEIFIHEVLSFLQKPLDGHNT